MMNWKYFILNVLMIVAVMIMGLFIGKTTMCGGKVVMERGWLTLVYYFIVFVALMAIICYKKE